MTQQTVDPVRCEYCGTTEGVRLECSRTCYPVEVRNRFERVLNPESENPDPDC